MRDRRRSVIALVGVGVFLVALIGIPARATYGAHTSADEPQYLLSALSLFDDGDLDISDERDSGAYREFHEAVLPVQTELRSDGTRISPHNPLLPALLSIPMGLGGWVLAKATLALLAGALASLLVWISVQRLRLGLAPAALVVTVFAVSPPLAVYSTQVYPEVPAALAAAVGLAALSGGSSTRNALLLTAAVVVLPWLAVKYVPIAALLGIAGLWSMRGSARLAGASMVVLLLTGLSYLWFNQSVYGGWTPYASGDFFTTGEFSAVGPGPNYLGRSQRLLALWADRGFGLVAWQPAYLLGLPALGWAARTRRKDLRLMLAVVAVGWLVATFLAQTMHGWWWPGRQVVVVLPLLILLVAAWIDGKHHRLRTLVVLGSLGFLSFLILAAEAIAGRVALIVDFTDTLNPFYRVWRLVLPDYLFPSDVTWVLHGVWLVAVVGLLWWGWQSPRPTGAMEPPRSRVVTSLKKFGMPERVQ